MFIPERIIDQQGVSIAATAHFCPATTELTAEWQECKALPELLGRKVSDGVEVRAHCTLKLPGSDSLLRCGKKRF